MRFEAPLLKPGTMDIIGTFWDYQDGCHRFNSGAFIDKEDGTSANLCKKRSTIIVLMIGAIALSIIGDIYSEKPLVNGVLLLGSFACAVWVILLWQK